MMRKININILMSLILIPFTVAFLIGQLWGKGDYIPLSSWVLFGISGFFMAVWVVLLITAVTRRQK